MCQLLSPAYSPPLCHILPSGSLDNVSRTDLAITDPATSSALRGADRAKVPIGRPTKYHLGLAVRARTLLSEESELHPMRYIASQLGISKETFYQWLRTNREFASYVEEGLANQEKNAVHELVNRKGNIAGLIFALKNSTHKFKDAQTVDVSYRIDDLLLDHARKAKRMNWDNPEIIDVDSEAITEQQEEKEKQDANRDTLRLSKQVPATTGNVRVKE